MKTLYIESSAEIWKVCDKEVNSYEVERGRNYNVCAGRYKDGQRKCRWPRMTRRNSGTQVKDIDNHQVFQKFYIGESTSLRFKIVCLEPVISTLIHIHTQV